MEYNYFKNYNPYETVENFSANLGNVLGATGPIGPGNVNDGSNENNILVWDNTNNNFLVNSTSFSSGIRGSSAANATPSNNKTVKWNSQTNEFYYE